MRDVLEAIDQGLRDPGRAGAGQQLQPGRPGPRPAGARRLDRGGAGCWAAPGRDHQRPLQRLDRRRRLRPTATAPNTGSRKSWAAGDATSRAVRLALMALKGEMGYPTALTAKTWGFQDVLFRGSR